MRPLQTRKLLAEDVADRIREEILSGGFGQGERLVEASIAQQLGVSRGPVREAFKLLRAEGLVLEVPHRGTFVLRLTSADVREIYDLRAGLEARAAKQVAASARVADLRTMRRLLERLLQAAEGGDVAVVSQADLAFHEGVCRLTGNRRLHEVFMRHVPVLRNLMKLDEFIYASLDDVAVEHEPLMAALESADPGLAAARFEGHVERARDQVATYIDALPDHP
ncbi:MAG TPA: GntR family transcriptional regulator [Thermoleophilia bacterium]|nr:GntR family transcriptional regulator [Thermoleophilia bacterium]